MEQSWKAALLFRIEKKRTYTIEFCRQDAAAEATEQQSQKEGLSLGIHGGGGEHQKIMPSLTESIPQSSVEAEVAPAGGDKPAGGNVEDPGKGQHNAQDQNGPDKPRQFF